MYFCLSGKGSEARSSQTATRLLAVLWFESLLLVWRLHSRTIRPAARFLLVAGRGNCVLFERNLSIKGVCQSVPSNARPYRVLLRRSLATNY